MMVELWMRKREMGDEDENDMEDTSGHQKSGVLFSWLSLEDLKLLLLHAGSGLVPAVSWMVNWLARDILLKSQFHMMISPISSDFSFLCFNSTTT